MKILIIGPFPNPITGQSIANETVLEGLKQTYEVDYIDTNFYKELTDKTKQGDFDFNKIKITFKNCFSDCKKILKNKYDIVYMTPGRTYLGFMRFTHYMICSFLKKSKVILHIHNGCFRRMYNSQNILKRKSLDILLKKVNRVVVLGESLRNMFEGIISEDKIYVCENGVQDDIVATEDEINEKMERYKNDTKKRVIYLSNLMQEKGILDLLKVSEKFKDDEIEFNLAGAIEPSIKQEIEDYLKKYPKKIKYHGIVKGEKKKQLLLKNYIFILPSYDEGQPISVLEAYATGCAVITDEFIGGIKDIFKNNLNGIRVESKNINSIKIALENIDVINFLLKNYIISNQKYKKSIFIKRIENILKSTDS
ncbi:glycosyltransferase family 4 protein [Candidatus Cetobacterium colombiensis]|uniref:Glycosyltransferase family 4 protein n=1 Tax=Candidatus Cetobacterium colombiensis TaxID=3073100 RepID=A0ABU4W8V3_9FUSO|nr:glycosyltransferase family 4 protein [Candidatus Cetobacterium colombiensis]MDX8335943.1 glycosyltransferase family 4 protein [Candidatus Cetobacterium colombiensis]